MNEVEKKLYNSDILVVDNNYVSNAVILVNKEFLLQGYQATRTTFTDLTELVELKTRKGEKVELTNIGTKCFLLENETIGIYLDKYNFVDYDLVRAFKKSYYDIYFTKQPFIAPSKCSPFAKGKNFNGYLIKVFSEESDKFIGCFSTIYREDIENE